MYLADHLASLDDLLKGQDNATKFEQQEESKLNGMNVWMIYIVGEEKKKRLLKLLKSCPLRFDSYVFNLLDPFEGKLL